MKEIFKIDLAPSDISRFVDRANTIPNDVNLFQEDNTVASGKSIMGVCALDFNKAIYMIVYDRTDDNIVYKTFGDWISDRIKKEKGTIE